MQPTAARHGAFMLLEIAFLPAAFGAIAMAAEDAHRERRPRVGDYFYLSIAQNASTDRQPCARQRRPLASWAPRSKPFCSFLKWLISKDV